MGVSLVGCDYFPGPSVRNELSTMAQLTVSYSDGETWTHEWSPCESVHLGAVEIGRWGIRPRQGVSIEEIVVGVNGEVVHRFDRTTIDKFVEEQNRQQGDSEWIIDRSGIQFSTAMALCASDAQPSAWLSVP